jgi:hypothetical protein
MIYLGFKKPPTLLLKLAKEKWKYLNFKIEKFDNGYYDIYDDWNGKRYYMATHTITIRLNILSKLTKAIALLNLRHTDNHVSFTCQEIIFNDNEIISNE